MSNAVVCDDCGKSVREQDAKSDGWASVQKEHNEFEEVAVCVVFKRSPETKYPFHLCRACKYAAMLKCAERLNPDRDKEKDEEEKAE